MTLTKISVEAVETVASSPQPLLVWGLDAIEPNTIEQAKKTARMPFVKGPVALMPDAHVGRGSTVGSVFATRGAIIPSAIGVDIGCGMAAMRLCWGDLNGALTSNALDDAQNIHRAIRKSVPAGMGERHRGHSVPEAAARYMEGDPVPNLVAESSSLFKRAVEQYGTLGGGNHFVEVCLDENDQVWVVLHSGSRGVGNELARVHIDKAKGLMREWFISLEDEDLAYLPEGTDAFDDYINDMIWAQEYARQNREQMLLAVVNALEHHFDQTLLITDVINCHHNFTQREHQHGQNVWVTRKGAIQARDDQLGIVPGSMATGTYIVRGRGNPASFESCSHGAGRRMSRGQAHRQLTADSLRERMEGKAWNAHDATKLVDEHPDAYKDIESVMAAQADLVDVVHHLNQVVNYKGTK